MTKTVQVFGQQLKTYNGKKGAFQKVIFKDEAGGYYDSMDLWLNDVPEGTPVSGTVESREYQGKTYHSFRAERKPESPIELVAQAPAAPSVRPHTAISQQDLRMLWGNCLNAASRVHAGSGDPEGTLTSLAVFYTEGLKRFFPEVAPPETSLPKAQPSQAVPPPPEESDIDVDSIPF